MTELQARKAVLARAFGAGDIKVALIVGEYPVPHRQLDEYVDWRLIRLKIMSECHGGIAP